MNRKKHPAEQPTEQPTEQAGSKSQAPPPYIAKEVSFLSKSGNMELNGTLTIPEGPGPFPGVVLITGSGAHNRDEKIFRHRPFWEVADLFTRSGIAVLRYDDRHYKRPTREGLQHTADDFAQDGLGALAYLQQQPGIDSRQIGMLGHSEGGLVAAMAASAEPQVAFVISIAGPGIRGAEIVADQAQTFATRVQDAELTQRWLSLMVEEPDAQRRAQLYRKLHREEYGRLRLFKNLIMRLSLPTLSSPWYYRLCCSDPVKYWQQVSCPVLALFGEHDTQVCAEKNSAAITNALQKSPCQDYTVQIIPEANHLFQIVPDGKVSSTRALQKQYASTNSAFPPQVLKPIAEWIQERTHGQ